MIEWWTRKAHTLPAIRLAQIQDAVATSIRPALIAPQKLKKNDKEGGPTIHRGAAWNLRINRITPHHSLDPCKFSL